MKKEKMKVYMIGIGGASMSGLCEILLEKDMEVCGSDLSGAARLEMLGVKVFGTHDPKNIPQGTQIVVYSSAISEENPELKFARERGFCVFSRGELLGLIARGFRKSVCVSGSHGKTTTTAMIAEIFAFAGKNASVHFGALGGRKTTGSGGDIFLCEACEYKDNFLHLSPSVGVITNVEFDHPDYFKSTASLNASFRRFGGNSKLVLCSEKVKASLFLKNAVTCEVWDGETGCESDFSARNLKCEKGFFTFDFFKRDSFVAEITLKVLGKFNVENALFACVVGFIFGATPFEIQKGISCFFGVERRTCQLACENEYEVFCDYAHHPTQINQMAELFENDYVCVFQPHTFSRTISLFQDFVSALSRFEKLIVTETYPAREKFEFSGSGKFLASKIPNAMFVEKEDIVEFLISEGYKKVVFLGAGDVDVVAKEFVDVSRD